MVAYLAAIIPEIDASDDGSGEDSWKSSIRMLYWVTIEVREPGELGGTRVFSFHVANFHNAQAIKTAFAGVSTVIVDYEPDVRAYLALKRHQ